MTFECDLYTGVQWRNGIRGGLKYGHYAHPVGKLSRLQNTVEKQFRQIACYHRRKWRIHFIVTAKNLNKNSNIVIIMLCQVNKTCHFSSQPLSTESTTLLHAAGPWGFPSRTGEACGAWGPSTHWKLLLIRSLYELVKLTVDCLRPPVCPPLFPIPSYQPGPFCWEGGPCGLTAAAVYISAYIITRSLLAVLSENPSGMPAFGGKHESVMWHYCSFHNSCWIEPPNMHWRKLSLTPRCIMQACSCRVQSVCVRVRALVCFSCTSRFLRHI